MPMSHFNEHTLEMAIMELFEQQGYSYVNGETIHKEQTEVLLRDSLLGISVHQIHPQVITQQHFRLLLVYRLAIHVAVALLLKQFHDGHLQRMFVKV